MFSFSKLLAGKKDAIDVIKVEKMKIIIIEWMLISLGN